MKAPSSVFCFLVIASSHLAGSTNPAFSEGEILLRQTAGEQVVEWRFTKSADTLRIEQITESRPPAPVNLIDLENGDVTIIAPINRSVRTLPASEFAEPQPDERSAAGTGRWHIPPGIGAEPSPPGTREQGHGIPVGAGPPTLPTAPELPAIADLPDGLPSLPPASTTPPPSGELVPQEKTRKFHGYQARLHTLRIDNELELVLWLANHPDLPPFAFPVSAPPPRYSSPDPMEDWPAMIRRIGHFPMFAELRHDPAHGTGEILTTWEVLSIHTAAPDPTAFEIPEGYILPNP